MIPTTINDMKALAATEPEMAWRMMFNLGSRAMLRVKARLFDRDDIIGDVVARAMSMISAGTDGARDIEKWIQNLARVEVRRRHRNKWRELQLENSAEFARRSSDHNSVLDRFDFDLNCHLEKLPLAMSMLPEPSRSILRLWLHTQSSRKAIASYLQSWRGVGIDMARVLTRTALRQLAATIVGTDPRQTWPKLFDPRKNPWLVTPPQLPVQ